MSYIAQLFAVVYSSVTQALTSIPYLRNVVLQLTGEPAVSNTLPFTADASTNNIAISPIGNVRNDPFSPLRGDGNYSIQLTGSANYITAPALSQLAGSTAFTVEAWVRPMAYPVTNHGIFYSQGSNTSGFFVLSVTSAGIAQLGIYDGATRPTSQSAAGAVVLNTWTHLAGVRNGNTWTLYVNGIAQTPATSSMVTAAAAPSIGRNPATSGEYFVGQISNLRVTNSAVYTSNFTVPTSPLAAVANTAMLTCQSNRILDNSPNNITLTRTGSPKVSPLTPFTYTDSTSSAYFNGATNTDLLTIPASAAIDPGAGDFTVEFWWYPTVSTTRQWFFHASSDYWLAIDYNNLSSNKLGMWASSNGTSWNLITSDSGGNGIGTNAVPVNQWNHIAYVRSGTTWTLYLNGAIEKQVTALSGTVIDKSSLVKRIGNHMNNTMGLSGYLSNFRFVKGVALYTSSFAPPTTLLTAVANTTLLTCQSSGPATNYGVLDSSQFNNQVTRAGAVSQGSFNKLNGLVSASFNGSTSLSTATHANLNTGADADWTVEGWWYFSNVITDGQELWRFTGYNPYAMLWSDGTMYYRASQTGNNIVSPFAHGMVTNTWYHWAFVKKGTQFTVYKNGAQVAQATYATALTNTSKQITFGNTATCLMSNFRFIKGTALYTAAFTVPTAKLTPVTGTQVLLFQNAINKDNSTNSLAITVNSTIPSTVVPTLSEVMPVQYDPSVHSGSLYFGGVTADYLTVPAGPQWIFAGDHTVEAWVYPTAQVTNFHLFGGGGSGSNDQLFITPGIGNAFLGYGLAGNYMTQTATIPLNTWSHIAVSKSAGTLRGFVNGVQVYSAAHAATIGQNIIQYIGKRSDNLNLFKGYILDLHVTTQGKYTANFTPLMTRLQPTASSLLLIAGTNGSIVDGAGISNILTSGATSVSPSVKKTGSNALYFTGASHAAIIGANGAYKFAGNLTAEFWVNPVATPNTYNMVIDNRISGTSNSFALYFNSSRQLNLLAGNGFSRIVSSAFTLNTWTHVALVRFNGIYSMYVNGVAVAGTYTWATALTDGNLVLGKSNDVASNYFNGYIDDLRITNSQALYTANFTPPTSLDSQ